MRRFAAVAVRRRGGRGSGFRRRFSAPRSPAAGRTSSSSSPTTRATATSRSTATRCSRPRTSTAWRRRACASRDFHVSPTCAPTRSALLSGRHEFKNGVTHTILERERMSLDTVTLAEVLRSAGYTTGIFGKWHLGDEDAYQPATAGLRRGVHPRRRRHRPDLSRQLRRRARATRTSTRSIRHNGTFVKTSGYCTDVFSAQALRWMEGVKDQEPFFAYIPNNAPHEPLQVRPRGRGALPRRVAEREGRRGSSA